MCMLRLFRRSASSCIFVLMPLMFSCSKFMLLVVVFCVLLAIWLGGGERRLSGSGRTLFV